MRITDIIPSRTWISEDHGYNPIPWISEDHGYNPIPWIRYGIMTGGSTLGVRFQGIPDEEEKKKGRMDDTNHTSNISHSTILDKFIG